MNINIYGVGRSGTKAVQLYASYLAAERYGSVKINYEPFYWKNRFLDMSFRGIECHKAIPLFADECQKITKRHKHYLKALNDYPYSITKFIRGNGRIALLNRITRPNYSIIVIRSLFDILNSIGQRQWDYLGKGLYYDDTKRFMNELKGKNIVERHVLRDIQSETDINALYWYAMNKYALENPVNGAKYIMFNDMEGIETLIAGIFQENTVIKLKNNRFEGGNIHSQYPLFSNVKRKNLLYERINRQLIKRIGLSFDTYRSGTIDRVVRETKAVGNEVKRSPKIYIEKKSLYEYFNNSIINKLNKLKEKE